MTTTKKRTAISQALDGLMSSTTPTPKDLPMGRTPKDLPNTALSEEQVQRYGFDQSTADAVNRYRAARHAPARIEKHVTYIIDPDLARKLKVIAAIEGVLLKDLTADVLKAFVDKWEENNQRIK